MLRNDPPIVLGSTTYTHKVLRQIQIDLPRRIFQFLLGDAREEADYIHIGKEIFSEQGGREFLLPNTPVQWTVQPDGLGRDGIFIVRLLDALKPFLAEAEQVIEETQTLPEGAAVFDVQLGEDKFRLHLRRESTKGKPVQTLKMGIPQERII